MARRSLRSGSTTIRPRPVSHVIVSLVVNGQTALEQTKLFGGGKDPYQFDLGQLPRGHSEVEVSGGWAGMSAQPGVELAFTDANGRNWIRYASERLIQIHLPADDYYRLDEPVNWEAP